MISVNGGFNMGPVLIWMSRPPGERTAAARLRRFLAGTAPALGNAIFGMASSCAGGRILAQDAAPAVAGRGLTGPNRPSA